MVSLEVVPHPVEQTEIVEKKKKNKKNKKRKNEEEVENTEPNANTIAEENGTIEGPVKKKKKNTSCTLQPTRRLRKTMRSRRRKRNRSPVWKVQKQQRILWKMKARM